MSSTANIGCFKSRQNELLTRQSYYHL